MEEEKHQKNEEKKEKGKEKKKKDEKKKEETKKDEKKEEEAGKKGKQVLFDGNSKYPGNRKNNYGINKRRNI